MAAHRQVGLDAVLLDGQPALLQARQFGGRQGLRHIRQRRSPPQGQRGCQLTGRHRVLAVPQALPPAVGRPLEVVQVESGRPDVQAVAA